MRVLWLLPLFAALAAVPLTVAGTAGATQTKAYNVTFKGTVQTDWNLPKYMKYQNCYDTYNYSGSGSETWNVRSKGPQKVLAYTFGNGAITSLQVGSWVLGEAYGRSGLVAKGETTRTGGFRTTMTPGTCGVGPQYPDSESGGDCGTRLVNYEILLNLNKGEITPDVLLGENGVREKTGYDTCVLVTPRNVVAGSWPAVGAKLPDRKLLHARTAFTVKGHGSWTGEVPPSHGTTTTTLDWQLTFTPAKAARKRR